MHFNVRRSYQAEAVLLGNQPGLPLEARRLTPRRMLGRVRLPRLTFGFSAIKNSGPQIDCTVERNMMGPLTKLFDVSQRAYLGCSEVYSECGK